ncbi:PTS fructose transporter subunit IIABC [Facklamia miroungae]|uniref:PTS system, fructose-specific IIC component n=1 Tax=Facklamia miroungae TaxID=120956 RepID=A0A1G7UN36_9LACT|nr:PTS fructose transporter subunit IIABC [Facklamia miroungae]NKZ30189.1 PTS transporter subunit EIIA [Facklamia miroungae]SDG48982.1 PTS system, fructose-specific IIC component [Facklamia miroungae]
MKISDLLNIEVMDLDLIVRNKSEALKSLVNNLDQIGGVSDPEELIQALKKREQLSTTGVGNGVAMPHAQSSTIKKPIIIFARSQKGINWEAMDEKGVHLIFMILMPEHSSNEHLTTIASLSKVLMKPGVIEHLMTVNHAQEVVNLFSNAQEDKEDQKTKKSINNTGQLDSYILAVTACPTGIAHTFMAEEKLKEAAQKAGITIKVETNGQAGIANKLTRSDIQKADAIIVAADKQVEMQRFDGKPVIITSVSEGINKADKLIERAVHIDAPIYHAKGERPKWQEQEENESMGRQIYKHLMNGVSHMLPFVVAGGILIALSFFWGINSADPTSSEYHPLAQILKTVGGMSFALMLPILSGFIGQSIADRPGLIVGLMGGVFANPGVLSSYSEQGIFEHLVPSGFLGALIAGFLAGAIIKGLQICFKWMPKSLEGMKSIFIFPVLGVLIIGILMLFVVNGPMGAVMTWLMNAIDSIPREWGILLGFVVGAMMSIDMGGPINKAAYVTGTALVTQAQGAGSDVMAAVMVGGMVPPMAIALAATIKPKSWTKQERSSAYVNYAMGASFITEGAIPFAAADPLRVIPSLAIGAGIAGALSMAFNCVSLVPHGGIFAVAAGGVSNPIMYLLSWLVGSLLSAILLNLTRRMKD